MPQHEADDLTKLGARIPISLKERLENYCAGEVDGQRHIQEDVVQLALSRYLNAIDKTGKILKESNQL